MIEAWGERGHVQAINTHFQRDRAGFRPQWLHQMRPDLGRLDTIAEILQVGPALTQGGGVLGVPFCAVVCCDENAGEHSMKVFRLAAVIVFLTGPAYAQNTTPNVNLIPELQSKTPEEKEAEEARDKAYKESLRKIPDAKVSSDPWGSVRGAEAPKAPAKPRAKTGSTAN
jgi:hypothetical protein